MSNSHDLNVSLQPLDFPVMSFYSSTSVQLELLLGLSSLLLPPVLLQNSVTDAVLCGASGSCFQTAINFLYTAPSFTFTLKYSCIAETLKLLAVILAWMKGAGDY